MADNISLIGPSRMPQWVSSGTGVINPCPPYGQWEPSLLSWKDGQGFEWGEIDWPACVVTQASVPEAPCLASRFSELATPKCGKK